MLMKYNNSYYTIYIREYFLKMEVDFMALYEYKCGDCGEVSEYLVFSGSDKVSCRKCGSQKLEKLLSSFAVSVKSPTSGNSAPECPYGSCCNGGSCGIQ